MNRFLRAASFLAVCLLATSASGADWTWTYSVQATAAVQASPARVTLQWPGDQIPATRHTIWRKAPDEKFWTQVGSLSGDARSFTDENVAVGGAYEYQIEKETALYSAWGYLAVGINAPLIEARGRVILVVERGAAGALGGEIRRLEQDLVGDGWGVIRKEVGRGDSPASVRDLIRTEWEADRANVRAVFLLGHVPVAKAGNFNVDGHGSRPMPADAYYGDLDGVWTDRDGDGILDQNGIPSSMELEVGRVDFADLPGAYASFAFPSEIDLLRRYLDKDHAFREARVRPPARALMGNVAGDGRGQAYAASGYRTFAALVGPENVTESGVDLLAPESERWITKLTTGEYLWTYASGAGSDFSLGILGTHGQFNDVWGSDFLERGAKATFYLLFGSWVAEWSKQDNLMRSALAAPERGLAAVWSGRPHYYFHHMALDRTIGHSVRVSQNNNGLLYRTHIQRHARGAHMALMGDPALRLHYLAPPANVRAEANGGETTVSWNASADAVLGYRVYRSASPGAPFERISGDLHADTRFTDRGGSPEATYMVRAVALQLTPSGSYYHASTGAFSRGDFSLPNRAPANLQGEPVATRITGAATEVGADIRHANGNIFDQVLLQGTGATMTADAGQILRVSFLDPDGDIVQVEMSGAGTLAVMLDDASGPGAPEKYQQDVAYMRGRATVAITEADASTNLSIFSVGRANAVNQSLFRNVSYDGVADIALVTITSLDGRFGAVRAGNVRFSAGKGLTGLYASDVQFAGPVVVGDIDARDGATPILALGAGTGVERTNEVTIAGGDLAQSNGRAVAINGITRVILGAGSTSHDGALPAQPVRGRLERNGTDVTAQVVSSPSTP